MEKEKLIEILRKVQDYHVDNFSEWIDLDDNRGYRAFRCPICKKECGGWEITPHLMEHKEFSYLKIIPSNPNDWVSVILNLLENNTAGVLSSNEEDIIHAKTQ